MAKKKGLAKTHRRAKRIVRSAKAPASNPPLFQDLVEFIVPGFAGYAATRFTSRVVRGMTEKRFPRLGKHAAVLSSLAAFGASWFLVHKVKKVAKYHTPVTVGAAIAAMQTVVQTYIPKYGWIVSDYQEPKALPSKSASTPLLNQTASGSKPLIDNFEPGMVDEDYLASLEAELDEGSTPSQTQPIGDDDDGLGDLLDDVGDYYGGMMGGMN